MKASATAAALPHPGRQGRSGHRRFPGNEIIQVDAVLLSVVDTYSTLTLRSPEAGRPHVGQMITLWFHLDSSEKVYGVFGDSTEIGALEITARAEVRREP